MSKKPQIAIIGAGGQVGAAAVNALVLLDKIECEVLLCDVVAAAAKGQALDIEDAGSNSRTTCRYAELHEAGQCDLVVITAGIPQQPGQSRESLLGANVLVMKQIIDAMRSKQPLKKDILIMVVSNPCDTLTYAVWKESGLPKKQVFGSGTYLDSCRLRIALAKEMNTTIQKVEALVLCEHGDRQFPYFSQARADGQLIKDKVDPARLDAIATETMRKAYTIIEGKRFTNYGIGMCVAHISFMILQNEGKEYLPLVHYHDTKERYISWPCNITRDGVQKTQELQLDKDETVKFNLALSAMESMNNAVNQAFEDIKSGALKPAPPPAAAKPTPPCRPECKDTCRDVCKDRVQGK